MRPSFHVAGLAVLVLLQGGCATNDETETAASSDAITGPAAASDSPWDSAEACEAAVADGRLAPRTTASARVATWNLRWFPDGTMPNGGGAPKPTNLAWVACAIRSMNVDVIAVEEILTHDRAKAAMDTVLARLNKLSGGDWRAEIDSCPSRNAQHQGFLYDARRVGLSHVRRFDWRDGDRCNMSRRPALVGYFAFASGLDLHMAAVHAKSGVDGSSYDLRAEALTQLGRLSSSARAIKDDADVVVLGDFNTMGSAEREVDSTAEIAALDRASRSAEFRRVRTDLYCSEYSRGEAKLLDQVLVSSAMAEAKRTVKATVSGYCAALRCKPTSTMPRAYTELSDHCPVVVDFDAGDAD